MDKKDLPVLPKGWRKMEEYKDLKVVEKSKEPTTITTTVIQGDRK